MATSDYVEEMYIFCLYLEHGSLSKPPFQSLIAMCKDSFVHQSAVPWFFYNSLPSEFC